MRAGGGGGGQKKIKKIKKNEGRGERPGRALAITPKSAESREEEGGGKVIDDIKPSELVTWTTHAAYLWYDFRVMLGYRGNQWDRWGVFFS